MSRGSTTTNHNARIHSVLELFISDSFVHRRLILGSLTLEETKLYKQINHTNINKLQILIKVMYNNV